MNQVGQIGAELAKWFEVRGALNEWPDAPSDPQVAVDRDYALAVNHVGDAPLVRVWRNRNALIIPRAFRNRLGFRGAVEACPFPVALRKSGGTAVMHGPHVLNLSLIRVLPREAPLCISEAYVALGAVIMPALQWLGVKAQLRDVAEAHCPGRYSIAVERRKLGGTAAFVVAVPGKRAVVAHANLVLQNDPDDLNQITAFERKIGMNPCYRENAHTSLTDHLRL